MTSGGVQKKADLGSRAFEWGDQEVGIRQQGSVIAAIGGHAKEWKLHKTKRKKCPVFVLFF